MSISFLGDGNALSSDEEDENFVYSVDPEDEKGFIYDLDYTGDVSRYGVAYAKYKRRIREKDSEDEDDFASDASAYGGDTENESE